MVTTEIIKFNIIGKWKIKVKSNKSQRVYRHSIGDVCDNSLLKPSPLNHHKSLSESSDNYFIKSSKTLSSFASIFINTAPNSNNLATIFQMNCLQKFSSNNRWESNQGL
ncbi:hypothetical protein ACTFIV_009611 [Dictyostelium citrinum]